MKKKKSKTKKFMLACSVIALVVGYKYNEYQDQAKALKNADMILTIGPSQEYRELMNKFRWTLVDKICKEKLSEEILFQNISSSEYSEIQSRNFLRELYQTEAKNQDEIEELQKRFRADLISDTEGISDKFCKYILQSPAMIRINDVYNFGLAVPNGSFPDNYIYRKEENEYSYIPRTDNCTSYINIIKNILDKNLPKLSDGIIDNETQEKAINDLFSWIPETLFYSLGYNKKIGNICDIIDTYNNDPDTTKREAIHIKQDNNDDVQITQIALGIAKASILLATEEDQIKLPNNKINDDTSKLNP